jgi:putative toxin-antitoxin system antitoxin component (TIGR02293 family)
MSRSRTPSQAVPAAAAKRQRAGFSYLAVYRASPLERIRMIKRGIRAAEAKRIIAELAIGQGAALKALKLSPATVNKKAKQNQALSSGESERVIGFAKLIGQLEAMIEESGNPEGFEAVAWMSRWLNDPNPALGGARPVDLMDTMEGQALVSTTLAQIQSGAYA